MEIAKPSPYKIVDGIVDKSTTVRMLIDQLKNETKKVAIIGASGYSGEELVQLLLNHPHAELAAVTSRQNAGQTLAQVFPKFASHPQVQDAAFQRAERRSARETGGRGFSRAAARRRGGICRAAAEGGLHRH